MNTDMCNLHGCDEFEGNQVLMLPLITERSMLFWTFLLFEKSKTTIGYSLAFKNDGRLCYVLFTHKETFGNVWGVLNELLPTFNALMIHDKLTHLSGDLKKVLIH